MPVAPAAPLKVVVAPATIVTSDDLKPTESSVWPKVTLPPLSIVFFGQDS